MDGGHIQNGLYYAIICKAGDQSLRSEKTDPEHCDGSKIMNWNPNPNDDLQVWLFDQIEPGQFEIVHCKSGLVMDEEKKEVKLKVGKQKKDQLFEVVPYTGQAFHKYYYLKTGEKKDQSLYLDGILRIAPLQEGNDQFLFRLDQLIIITKLSKRVLSSEITYQEWQSIFPEDLTRKEPNSLFGLATTDGIKDGSMKATEKATASGAL